MGFLFWSKKGLALFTVFGLTRFKSPTFFIISSAFAQNARMRLGVGTLASRSLLKMIM